MAQFAAYIDTFSHRDACWNHVKSKSSLSLFAVGLAVARRESAQIETDLCVIAHLASRSIIFSRKVPLVKFCVK